MCEEYIETDYPVLTFYIDYDFSYEVPGDYYYTYGVQVEDHEDITVEIDLNEEPYCDWYEAGWDDMDILTEVIVKDYTYGEINKWTIYDENHNYIATWTD